MPMKKSLLLVATLVFISGPYAAFAQTPSERQGPPPVLLIVREDIKPGMMARHNRHSVTYAGIFSKVGATNHRIAMTPVAGSENEVLYITPAGSFAELEKISADADKRMSTANASISAEIDRLDKEAPDLHAGMRDLMAAYRPELSYNPGVNIAEMRYFAVTTVRIRPGQEDLYADLIRNVTNVAREKVKAELHVAAFQVIAGMPGTTYMFFRPMKSLGEYDLRIGPRVREAMTDDQKKKADKLAADSVISSETIIYAFNPRMSFMPKEFIARDPAFWNPPADVVARPKPRKRTPKIITTGATQ